MTGRAQEPSEVELEKLEVIADGYLRLERLTLRTDTFAGGTSGALQREVLRAGPAVAILLYDPAPQKLILIEQFRVGAYVNQKVNQLASAWLLECVAGKIDEGETSEVAARREAMEESGCQVQEMEFAGAYLSSPGTSDELVSVYLGRVDSARVGGVHGEASEGEDIRTVVLSVDEALAAADNGTVINMVTQVALLWFARHGDAVRRKWLGSEPTNRA